MKLLIVDDSALIRRAINTAYQGTVFTEIQTAADGVLAVTSFKQVMPDVVTLDITMPHMDGLAAMSQMLEIKPNTIILVISALADHHTAIEALVRGAHQFICKPFTSDDLKDALDQLLKDNRDVKSKASKVAIASKDLGNSTHLGSRTTLESPERGTQIPNQEQYPSGYVKPPEIQHPPSPNRPTSATSRQIPLNLHNQQPLVQPDTNNKKFA